ncbi:acetoacetate--CoA ligase [Actinomycetes bacterium M1A6_2h]
MTFDSEKPVWTPSPEFAENSLLAQFSEYAARRTGRDFDEYDELWSWSVTELGDFWMAVRDYFRLDISEPTVVVDSSLGMNATTWFTGSTTNYAACALEDRSDRIAVRSLSEDGVRTELGAAALRLQVGALGHWLRDHGVEPGDTVVAYVPNVAAAVTAMLACASVGAIWASCAQEYSAEGAHDRFGPLKPRVLIAADGYHYGGKTHDRRPEAERLAGLLDSVHATLWIDNVGLGLPKLGPRTAHFDDVVADGQEPDYVRVEFDHPLWVLFSSGTTGKPKGIVHSHGGILLEHTKFLGLHADIQPGSTFLWLATPSWMVWNVQVSGLLRGATITTFDGNPSWPEPSRLWQIADELEVDFLGTSAAALTAASKHGARPSEVAPGLQIRAIGSTGSPLPASTAYWVAEQLPDVWLASASGGTDICSAFAGGIPTRAVHGDEIQGPLLGVALQSLDDTGTARVDQEGEMVVSQPMPSMPIRFWNDPEGTRYRETYFDEYPGVWHHGDRITITSRGGVVVHGRSDATINRHGVRIGSAEIYDVVEQLAQVTEALVVGVELDGGAYWMPMFVVESNPTSETGDTIEAVRRAIRSGISPRHVPDDIIVVTSLPHTRTGKKMEVPIKRILQGHDPFDVVNPLAVDNPGALEQFVTLRRTGKVTA